MSPIWNLKYDNDIVNTFWLGFYKITIVDTYKTMYVVTSIGLVLSDRVLHDCMSVIIDGHISIGIACQ